MMHFCSSLFGHMSDGKYISRDIAPGRLDVEVLVFFAVH